MSSVASRRMERHYGAFSRSFTLPSTRWTRKRLRLITRTVYWRFRCLNVPKPGQNRSR